MAHMMDFHEAGEGSHPSTYRRKYEGTYHSFSGVDIVAYIHIPSGITKEEITISDVVRVNGKDIPKYTIDTATIETFRGKAPVMGVLGTLQSISYSTYRDVAPVRSLGKVYAHAYTRGARTIAGTMVWTMLDQHVLARALRLSPIEDYDVSTILTDQLPPFNIIITFNNEYGGISKMGIYGVRVVNEGVTLSIDDLITEQTNTYVAADIAMPHKGRLFKDNQRYSFESKKASYLIMEEAKKRVRGHRNVFL